MKPLIDQTYLANLGATLQNYAISTAADRVQTGLDRAAVSTDRTAADASYAGALLAATTVGLYPNAAATYIPKGLQGGQTITPGSGGTNGTFAIGFSGGNYLIQPTGTFTVSGGAVTSYTITNPGLYLGAAPTSPTISLSASAGLTGASIGNTTSNLYTTNQRWWVQSSDLTKLLNYYNDGTSTPHLATDVNPIYTAAGIDGKNAILSGTGTPGYNVGIPGQFYQDTTNLILYGPKTSAGWNAGIPITSFVSIPSTKVRVDMRAVGAVFPSEHWTFTRNSVSTDLLYDDDYTYNYTTYGVNVPIMRVGLGFGAYMKSQQLLANPTAPTTETITLAVGTHILTAWGPAGSSVTATLGTAVATMTSSGVLAGNAKSYVAITVTTSGTVTFTPSGGLTKINVTYNPSSPTISEPVPFIATQSTREADKAVGTALAIGSTMLGATAAYLLMGVSKVTTRSYGRSPTLFGLNNVTAGYIASATVFTIYDPANHISSLQYKGDFFAGATVGRTWDATASLTAGAGYYYESSHPYQYNNATAVTSARLGASSTADTFGNNMLNGFIGWYEIDTAGRISDEALYEKYTSIPSPSVDKLLRNYNGPNFFRKNAAALRQLYAGVVNYINWAVIGPSHEGGTGIGTNVRANGWPPQMIAMLKADADLAALGIEFNDDTFAGTNSAPWSGGGNANDARVSYTGSAPTLYGVQYGGETTVIPDGSSITFTPVLVNNQFELAFYLAPSGYGGIQVSVDGGVTPLTPVGGGSSTVSSTGTAALTSKFFNAPSSGANVWTIKATGGPVHISMWASHNTAKKQIMLYNGGRNGFNVTNLASNGAPESNYSLPIRYLAPTLCFGCGDQTNDMASGGTAWSTYNTMASFIISNAAATGDCILFIDPPTSTTIYAQTLQDTLFNYARSIGWASNVPMYDLPTFGNYAYIFQTGAYGSDTIHLAIRGQKRLKANQMYTLAKRLCLAA